MAGGEGTRLRPITESMPKPLVAVGGIPVIEHIFRLLLDHGITEAAITTRYLGEMIEKRYRDGYEYPEGSTEKHLLLRFFREDKPLGTAGGVKNAESFYGGDETFLVISGDAMTDIDLSEMISAHREKGAAVTIALSSAADPREYGTVLCDGDGRIARFIEKPAWQHVLTDSVNTGIYLISPRVMDAVPREQECDFARDLFPTLLRGGERMFGYESDANWCDIGSITDYRAENMRLSGGGTVFPASGSYTAAPDTAIIRSIIYDGVSIGKDSLITGSVICDGCTIGSGVTIGEGSIIGSDCIIGDGAVVASGTRMHPKTQIGAGESVGEAGSSAVRFEQVRGGLHGPCDIGGCMMLGFAMAKASGAHSRIGVVGGYTAFEHIMKQAVLCGIAAGGAIAYDFGDGYAAMASFAAARLGMDHMLHIGAENRMSVRIRIYDRSGLYPDRKFERALRSAMDSGSTSVSEHGVYDIERCSDLETIYRAALIREGRDMPWAMTSPRIRICVDGSTSQLLSDILTELGFNICDRARADILITLGADGTELTVTDRRDGGSEADMWHVGAILALDEIKRGRISTVALPYIAPLSVEKLLSDGRVTVAKYRSCPSDAADSEARRAAAGMPWLRDAAFAAVKLCVLLGGGARLSELSEEIPDFYLSERQIKADDRTKTRIMRAFGMPDDEGIRIEHKGRGYVRIVPECEMSVRVIAEASNAEAASELISLSEEQIRKIIG